MGQLSTDQRHLAALTAVVRRWSGRPILVVGDAMLDEWRFATSARLCREAPAPVLTLDHRQVAAGGAANTAVNLATLGARPLLVAPIGADPIGDQVARCLHLAGVQDRMVAQPGTRTPVKRRLLAADQILLREDEGGPGAPLPAEQIDRLLAAIVASTEEIRLGRGTGGGFDRPDLVICDYGLGALPEPVRRWLIDNRHRYGTVALDAHDLRRWAGLRPSVITPSIAEATMAVDHGDDRFDERVDTGPDPQAQVRVDAARRLLPRLRTATNAEVIAVTLDVDGSIVDNGSGEPHRCRAEPVPASRAVGAGDAYLAALTLAVTAGAALPASAELAQLAATLTVGDTGTCVCRCETLLAALTAGSATASTTATGSGPTATRSGPTGPQAAATRDPDRSGGTDPTDLIEQVRVHLSLIHI